MRTRLFCLVCILIQISFVRLSAETPILRVGIIADCQYEDRANNGLRFYNLSLLKLNEALNTFQTESVDFVISLGDLFNHNYKGFKSVDSVISLYPKLNIYHTLGSHDFLGNKKQQKEVFQAMNVKERYYTFKQQGIRFIILDGNDISIYGTTPGSIKRLQAEKWLKRMQKKSLSQAVKGNGGMSPKQIRWLENLLINSEKNKEPIIICSHYPIWSKERADLLWNSQQMNELLGKYAYILAYLCGHNHHGGHKELTTLLHYNFMGMVDSNKNRFSILEIYTNRLEIKGYGQQPNHIYSHKNKHETE